MKAYNKLMQIFWLAIGILVLVVVTYKGITSGFDRWATYYIFALVSFFMFFIRRYMMRRMKKHQAFLDEQKKKTETRK